MIWLGLAAAVYGAMVLMPLCLLIAAPSRQRRLAVGAVAAVLACSLPAFTSTPDGVLRDSLEGAHLPLGWPDPPWWQVWGAQASHHGVRCWNVLPVALGHRLTGSWLVEPVLGLFWHSLLIVTLVAVLEPVMVPVTVGVLAATRFGLWIQRHHMGSDILLLQVLLLVCLSRLRIGAIWWVLPAATAMVLLHLTYWAAMITFIYPVIVLGVRRRTAAVYALFGLGMIPAAFSWTELFGPSALAVRFVDTVRDFPPRAFVSLAAFWDARYSVDSSWLWSYPGAQHLPAVACLLIALGAACALFDADARRWVILFIFGALMTTLGGTAASHRQMMALLPAAVLAAWPLRFVPAGRVAWVVSIALAVCIAVEGLREWHDPAFWIVWAHAGEHGL